ncbi:hypothetical protein F5Y03DRAFT_396606 [Xylaria venustula]|nr:hypothetical protein F5Y03DRAFT_396606 [Xylaria venustula]
MELVDPELRDALPSSTSSLPATANSVEDAHGSIPTTPPAHIESSVIQPLCNIQPVAIDAKRGIWEAEAGKDFRTRANTWEKQKDISPELVEGFEATYQGNHLGVRLLEKRARRGKVEYLVEWRGRPGAENSWEKEATISRERDLSDGRTPLKRCPPTASIPPRRSKRLEPPEPSTAKGPTGITSTDSLKSIAQSRPKRKVAGNPISMVSANPQGISKRQRPSMTRGKARKG